MKRIVDCIAGYQLTIVVLNLASTDCLPPFIEVCILQCFFFVRLTFIQIHSDIGCICIRLAVQAMITAGQFSLGIIDDILDIADICSIALILLRDRVLATAIFCNAVAYIRDNFTATIDAILRDARATRDRQAIAIDRCRRLCLRSLRAGFRRIGSTVQSSQILGQLDFQLAIVCLIDTDVVYRLPAPIY